MTKGGNKMSFTEKTLREKLSSWFTNKAEKIKEGI
jgi:hypothetical protein